MSELTTPQATSGFESGAPVLPPHEAKELAPDHAVVLLNYLLLALSPLTFFISGLIAVIVGLIRKGGSNEVARSHFRLQRTTFWIVLIITVVGLIAALVCFLTGMVNLPWGSSYRTADGAPMARPRGDETMAWLGFGGLALSILVVLASWLFGLVRIVYGVVRIAMDRGVGRARPDPAQAF